MLQDSIKQVLSSRKREELVRFREANPLLGMALRDDDTYLGFYELGGRIPSFALTEISKDVGRSWKVDRVYNADLRDLLLESNHDRLHPPIIFNPLNNTASGEPWE